LSSIAITPANTTISVGSNLQFAAQGIYSDGTTADLSSSVSWSSSDKTMASISGSGLAAALAIGRPQITATSDGTTGSTRLIVVEGAAASFPRFVYSTSLSGIISIYTVDAASGQLRAKGYVEGAYGALTTDPAGKFIYVLDYTGGVQAGFTIDPAGGLTLIPNSAIPGQYNGGALMLAIDPSGTFAYLPDLSNGILGFAIDRTSGILTPFTGSTSGGAGEMAFHPSGRFGYVTGGAISAYEIDVASGALTPVAGSPFATSGGTPGNIAIDPAGKFAVVTVQCTYVGCPTTSPTRVSTFMIDGTTGALTPASQTTLSMGALSSGALAITPNGQYAYVADYSGNKIWGLLLNGITGDVSPLPAAPFMTGSPPGPPVVDPSGRFLYVVNGTSFENITTYAIDYATGNLSKLKTVRTRGQGGSIALTAGAAPVSYMPKYVYVANNSGNNVSAYTINPATGSLTNVTGSPFAAGSGPSVAADPAGKFLYAVNAAGGTVSAFTVDQTSGVLSAVAGSPFGGGSLMLPSSMVVDPTGTIAYVTNSAPGSTRSFMIDRTSGALSPRASLTSGTAPGLARMDPTGQFLYLTNPLTNNVSVLANETQIAGSPFAAGTDPLGLAIHPSGQFVYVANQVSNSLSAFSIGAQTGALSEIAGSPYTTTGPLALAIDGTGSFLYVANHSATNNISAYSIDPFTGALALLPGSPFTAGNAPNDVAVDFSGKFLYVANGGSDDVSVFSINAVNGTLTQVAGSPFAAGSVPGSVVTTGQIE
jgi:6-phosphogluconolactonase (cycloisomerase 2 family)